MWLWNSAWASGPIRKMDVYHWFYDPTMAPQNLSFRPLKRKEGFWYPQPTMFIVNPFYPNSQIPFYLLKACSWRFSVQSAPSLNSSSSFVPHVQWHDANLMVEDFLGLRVGIFPLITSMPLYIAFRINSFPYIQQSHSSRVQYTEPVTLSHFLVRLQIPKICLWTFFSNL